MADILITAVGNRDPKDEKGNGMNGPILTAVEAVAPSEVYLVFTSPPAKSYTQNRAIATQDLLERAYNVKTRMFPVHLPDPTDYDSVLSAFRRICDEIRSSFEEKSVSVTISSGTPAMQAAWLLLVSQGILPAVPYYVPHPDFVELGHAPVREVSIGFLQEDALIKTARLQYRSFQFHAAARDLTTLSESCNHASRRKSSSYLARFCEALGLWDDYRLRMAAGKLREVSRWIAPASELEAILRQLPEDEKEETPLILTDLYHNADRSYHRGQYADSLARSLRTYEGVLRLYLRMQYGMPVRLKEIDGEKRKEIVKFFDQSGIRLDEEGHLMRRNIQHLLAEYFKDEKFIDWQNEMDILANLRNRSIVAHGTQEIRSEAAEKALRVLKDILISCRCNVDDYPIASERLMALENELFAML